ncbi:hypothetical protein ABID82_007233 [Methylobacterium sp. PvP062]|uniref:Uncharacterized protein n=1 Tax=Methylobacterium radiotolerans TaxID=31998 RepID=A0ABV2NTI5_9HYPH|nr:hypothetical protein [Methylobacterium sp. PvP105]MBP2498174.1 hypothetical protein [Methylobacterium sp. PvP105]MBP2498183.1 hypothetical protein [Methylobacterium sp. PvP105]MBP2498192.1 hypothetical protein [Methylobacterium sp. PvP105]
MVKLSLEVVYLASMPNQIGLTGRLEGREALTGIHDRPLEPIPLLGRLSALLGRSVLDRHPLGLSRRGAGLKLDQSPT